MGKKSRQSTGSQPAASPATTPKPKQASTKSKQTPTKSPVPKVTKAPTPEPEAQADEDWEDEESEEEDEEDDGVTEEGMQRLMALLEKEDALDEFDMAQLGEGSEDEEASDDEEEDEEVEEEDDEMDAQVDDEEDAPAPKRVRISTEDDVHPATEGDLALDDLESDLSVDEDAIPQRKVTKNNKVSRARVAVILLLTFLLGRA
jgi:rRNA-processing protein EBP2